MTAAYQDGQDDTGRRKQAADDYVLYLGGSDGADPALERLARTDVFVIRESFKAGWGAALESRDAEVSALREVIEKAIHVEDEYFAQPFMWQVGKMRGILEAGLASAVASPETRGTQND